MKLSLQKFWCVIIISIVPIQTITSQWITGNIDTLTFGNSVNYYLSPKSIIADNENTLHVVWQKDEVLTGNHFVYYSEKRVDEDWTVPIQLDSSSEHPSILFDKVTNGIFLLYNKNDQSGIKIILKRK